MRPCDFILIHLLALESSTRKNQTLHIGGRERCVREERASVQHISNSADFSFIRENLLWKLLIASWDTSFGAIEITDDTVVVLEWYYPKAKKTEVTRHLVVQESSFDIILRREDWERPVRELEEQLCKRTASHAHSVRQVESHVAAFKADIDPGCETDCDSAMASSGYLNLSSRRTSATSISTAGYQDTFPTAQETMSPVYICNSHGEESEDSETTLRNARGAQGAPIRDAIDNSGSCFEVEPEVDDEEIDWGEIEVSYDDPSDVQEDAYWDWSPAQRRWFHKDIDGIRWFPEYVESY